MNRLPDRSSHLKKDIDTLAKLLRLTECHGDPQQLAEKLTAYFGGLKMLERADDAALAEQGLGSLATARQLRFFIRFVTGPEKGELKVTDIRGIRYAVFSALCDLENEQLLIFPVTDSGKLRRPETVQGDTRIITVMQQAKAIAEENGCCYLLLAHNHPKGSFLPSDSDIRSTRILNRELAAFGIQIIDHFIVSPNGICSLKERGKFFDYE